MPRDFALQQSREWPLISLFMLGVATVRGDEWTVGRTVERTVERTDWADTSEAGAAPGCQHHELRCA